MLEYHIRLAGGEQTDTKLNDLIIIPSTLLSISARVSNLITHLTIDFHQVQDDFEII